MKKEVKCCLSPQRVEQWSKKGGDMRLSKIELEATKMGISEKISNKPCFGMTSF
jgi:hypothetical protein